MAQSTQAEDEKLIAVQVRTGNVHPLWFSVLLTLIFTAGHSFEKSGKKLQTSFVQGYFMSHTKNW